MTNFPNGCVRQLAASAVLLLSYGQVPPVSSALAEPEVVIPITTLAPDGEGSLRRALDDPRPRLVVFEVGGVVDLAGRSIAIRQPHLVLAGQTAPDPGITVSVDLMSTGVDM